MGNSIKGLLAKHRKLNYFQRCFRRRNDISFVEEVLEIGKNPLKLNIKHYGEKNKGKLLYICQTMGCDGFFAELRFILSELFFADTFGFLPIVLMPQNSCYCENHPVNGATNPFEYYFDRVSDVTFEDALDSYAVVEHNYYQRNYMETVFKMNSGYLPSEDYMKTAAELVNRYIHLNMITRKTIYSDIQGIIGEQKTLGVHVRGADFKRHYAKHPHMVTVDEYLEAVKKAIDQFGFDMIFLATDDLDAIEKFSKTFSNKVVFYKDVVRTDGDETVMKSERDRKDHHYRLGYEVIRDVYTLAECDGIIAGLSNVSIFARIIKISEQKDYQYMNYINKGIK